MITKILYKLSAHLRCRLIHRKAGEPYLERYWLFSLFGVSAYLHRFVASDIDEGPHDHPWRVAVAMVLAGGYTEERGYIHPTQGFVGKDRQRKRWRINIIQGHDFHRIKSAKPETWTLFIHTKKSKPWGFILAIPPEAEFEGAAIYHQPHNTDNAGWQFTAPTGQHVGRQPFGVSSHDANPAGTQLDG